MSNQDLLPPEIKKNCPICATQYLTKELAPNPTCGNPNCIREARARGLPFVHPYPIRPLIPATGKKRTRGKPK